MRPKHIDPFRSVQFCIIIILLAVDLLFIDETVQPNNIHFFSFLFIYSLTHKKTTFKHSGGRMIQSGHSLIDRWHYVPVYVFVSNRFTLLLKITTIDSKLGFWRHGRWPIYYCYSSGNLVYIQIFNASKLRDFVMDV